MYFAVEVQVLAWKEGNMAAWLTLCWILSLPFITSAQTIDYKPPPKTGNPKLESQLWQIATLSGVSQKPVALPAGLQTTAEGKVVVFLVPEPGKEASSIDTSGLRRLNGKVLAQSRHLIRVALPPTALEEATRIPGVNFIQRPIRPQAQRVVSEGARLINATANHVRGVKGQGAKVAIIDPGFKDANLLLEDMPLTWRVRDFTQATSDSIYSGDEVHGTACAEVIFDVAPEAEIYLLKFNDIIDFENAKDACIQEDVNIISYSGSWLGTGFGDGRGLACDIVNDAADKGILWINAAGNYAKRQYSGLWADQNSNGWDDINGPNQTSEILELSTPQGGDTIEIWLTWNDWPQSFQDYDLSLYRLPNIITGDTLQVVSKSSNIQRGSEPVEHIEYQVTTSGQYGIAVSKLESSRTEIIKVWSVNHDFVNAASLIGNIGTPADARGALSVGAVYHGRWSSGTIEDYSSRGPTVDGRIKPDLVAPTGVSTVSYGANGFFGTSAAAPHIAGAAALIKSAHPSYTRTQLVAALLAATVDLWDRGNDNTYGAGKLVLPLLQLPVGPNISSVSPASIRYGQTLILRGQNFGNTRDNGKVVFYENVEPSAAQYLSWTDTEIHVIVPIGARRGEVHVINNQGTSNGINMAITSPWIGSISPTAVRTGQRFTISGENFGSSRGSSTVSIGSTIVPSSAYVSWSSTSVALNVPVNTPPGNVTVQTGEGQSNPFRLEITSPYITNITPTSARPGDQIAITGGNFGSTRGASFVSFGSIRASPSDYVNWTNTRIAVKVPAAAQVGDVKVVTASGESGTRRLEVSADRLERLPSVGVFGYSPPSVTGNPKKVSFEFQGIGRDILVGFEVKEVDASEVEIYANNTLVATISSESIDWKLWYFSVNSSTLRTGQNILEFRNTLNQNRSSDYARWQLRNVRLWKPFDAKPIGELLTPIASLSSTLFNLGLPFPSPFNSSITIPYTLSESTQVRLFVYNLAGQRVNSIFDGFQTVGAHTVLWNGKDINGEDVSSGIYWIVFEAGEIREVARVVLLR